MSPVKQKQTADDPRLSKLKEILLRDDEDAIRELKAEIRRLESAIHDRDQLMQLLGPVIADVLDRKIHDAKGDMAKALAPVMADAIKVQVREAKEDVVDALYPVIGRMITKAVSEAIKRLAENINQQINRRLKFQLWLKRRRARAMGVDVGEMLLAEEGGFFLEELFFIHRSSGLLIMYVGQNHNTRTKDAGVLGGMLTVIKTFVEDAFSENGEGELREIEYSNRGIRIDPGRYTYLAAVYQGVPPPEFDEALQRLHHRIHSKYYKKLREYDGNNVPFTGIEKLSRKFFKTCLPVNQ